MHTRKPCRTESAGGASIAGVGIDIVDIPRFRRTIERHGPAFINRLFLPSERKYCSAKPTPWVHYAGRFAAKEAVAKAFGTGIGKEVGWLDMEIVSPKSRPPEVSLSARLRRLAGRRGIGAISISISHTRAASIAFAILTARTAEH